MPGYKSEDFSAGDQSWLGSTHGLRNARTEAFNPTAFSSVAVDGVIPSGLPLAKVGGSLVPYAPTAETDASILVGFLLTEQRTAGGAHGVPVLDHGRVKTNRLPVTFTPPAAAKNLTTIVFIQEA